MPLPPAIQPPVNPGYSPYTQAPLAPLSSAMAMQVGLGSPSLDDQAASTDLASSDDLLRRRRMRGSFGGFGGDVGGLGLGSGVGLSFGGSGNGAASLQSPGFVTGPTDVTTSVPGSGTGTTKPMALDPSDPGYVAVTSDPTPMPLVPGIPGTSPDKDGGGQIPTVNPIAPTIAPHTGTGTAVPFNNTARAPQPVGLMGTGSSPLGLTTSAPGQSQPLKNGGRVRGKRKPVTIDMPRYAKGGKVGSAFSFAPTYQDYLATNAGQNTGGSEAGSFSGLTPAQWAALSGDQQWNNIGGGVSLDPSDPRYAALAQQLGMTATSGPDSTLGIGYGAPDLSKFVNPNAVLSGDGTYAYAHNNLTPEAEQQGGGLSNRFWAFAPAMVVGAGLAGAAMGAAGSSGGITGASSALETGGFGTGVGAAGSGLPGAAVGEGLGAGAAGAAGDGSAGVGTTGIPDDPQFATESSGFPDDPGFAAQGGDYGVPPGAEGGTGAPAGGGFDSNGVWHDLSPMDNVPGGSLNSLTTQAAPTLGGGLTATNAFNAARGVAGLVGLAGSHGGSTGQVAGVDTSGGTAGGTAVNPFSPGGTTGAPGAPGTTAASDASMNFDPSDYVINGGTGNWQQARSSFQPIESALFADALKAGSPAEQEAAAGRAASDAAQQAKIQRDAARGRLIAQGYTNPDDARGAGAEMNRLADLDAAKVSVGGQNAARISEANRGAALKAQAVAAGQADAAQGLSADNIGLQASLGNQRTLAGLQGQSMSLATQRAIADANRGLGYSQLGETTRNNIANNNINVARTNSDIATGNANRNAAARTAQGAGVNTLINGAQGIYNLGSNFGFWKDGGRIGRRYNKGGRVKRHLDVGLRYANGGTVFGGGSLPVRVPTGPYPADPSYPTNPTGRGGASFVPNPGYMLNAQGPNAMTGMENGTGHLDTMGPGGSGDFASPNWVDSVPVTPPASGSVTDRLFGAGARMAPAGGMDLPINPVGFGGGDVAGPVDNVRGGFGAGGDPGVFEVRPGPGGAADNAISGMRTAMPGGFGAGAAEPDNAIAGMRTAMPGSGMGMTKPLNMSTSLAARMGDVGLGTLRRAMPAINAQVGPYAVPRLSGAPGRPGVTSQPMAFKKGGRVTKRVKSYQSGGPVSGPGTATSDSIRARLSDGEHVVNTEGTQLADAMYPGLLDDLNEKGLAIRRVRQALSHGMNDVGLGD